jgi:hypothetical protein
VSRGTFEEMHWEVLPHPIFSTDLVSRDYDLFGPLKEALGGEGFRTNNEVKQFVQRCLDEQQQTLFGRGVMMTPERRKWYRGGRICRKKHNPFERKKIMINIFLKRPVYI